MSVLSLETGCGILDAVISKLRRAAINWVVGLSAAYVVLVLSLNYFMLAGNNEMARISFYLLAAGVPVGIMSAARVLARVHRELPQDDLREGTIPILWGVGFAACIYIVSIVTR